MFETTKKHLFIYFNLFIYFLVKKRKLDEKNIYITVIHNKKKIKCLEVMDPITKRDNLLLISKSLLAPRHHPQVRHDSEIL